MASGPCAMLFAGFWQKKKRNIQVVSAWVEEGKPKFCVFVCGVRFNYSFTFNSRLLLLLTEHNNDKMDCLALGLNIEF